MRAARFLTLLPFLPALPGCASVSQGAGLEHVWPATRIYLPGREPVRVQFADLQSLQQDFPAPLPTVIFLHGCSGYMTHYLQAEYPAALAQAGFAVFVPDSFARPGRKPACGNVMLDTVNLRRAEVDDTLERLQAIPWVDRRNLFLAGHSEGGIATAMYRGGDFRAYFISGWTCRSVSQQFNQIHAPSGKPVLAVLGADDHYYRAQNSGHCGEAFGPFASPRSRSVVLPGIGHEANTHPDTIPLLISFFKASLRD